jgi:hypothetical protein
MHHKKHDVPPSSSKVNFHAVNPLGLVPSFHADEGSSPRLLREKWRLCYKTVRNCNICHGKLLNRAKCDEGGGGSKNHAKSNEFRDFFHKFGIFFTNPQHELRYHTAEIAVKRPADLGGRAADGTVSVNRSFLH